MFSNEQMVMGVLKSDAFVMVNKKMARSVGFLEAGLLAELIFTYSSVKEKNEFYKKGEKGPWFYMTQPSVEKNLGIKRDSFDTAIKNLVNSKVIFKKRMGLPAKNYYQIDWNRIVEILSKNDDEPAPLSDCGNSADLSEETPQTCIGESPALDVGNPAVIKKNLEKEFQKKDSKKLVNNLGVNKNDLLEIINSFYSEMAPTRWTKKQWITLSNKLADELMDGKEYFEKANDPFSYARGCLEQICYKHDLKTKKIEPNYPRGGKVPFYNWLET